LTESAVGVRRKLKGFVLFELLGAGETTSFAESPVSGVRKAPLSGGAIGS